MSKIKMMVFDMAGTTVNENNLVYKTVQAVIEMEGVSVTLPEVLTHGAGKEKHQAIVDVLTAVTGRQDVAQIARNAFARFKPALQEAYTKSEIAAFDGVEELLARLRHKELIVVLNTGYDRKTAAHLLNRLYWSKGKHFDQLVTADDVANGRPHPDMIFKAMESFGISDALQVLKAGDSDIDILEGKNAGCGLTVGVLSGAQNREQLAKAGPDYILNSLSELESVLF